METTTTQLIYAAAHQEVVRVQVMLEEHAARFNETFLLSPAEADELNVHAELHASGGAIELSVGETDVVFSLGTVPDCKGGRDAWELVAFPHGDDVPQWVSTMRVGPIMSEYSRRLRGARLVAVIGDYLERQQQTDVRGGVIDVMRMESSEAWLPQVTAHSMLAMA